MDPSEVSSVTDIDELPSPNVSDQSYDRFQNKKKIDIYTSK